MPPEAEIAEKGSEDSISALSNDLLVHMLLLVPTKDAVATMILSKRWRFVWNMLPKIDYRESYKGEKSVWDSLNKSLQLLKAPLLESLRIQLRRQRPVDADVEKWVLNALDRCVRELNLEFNFLETADPTGLPKSLYTCETLVYLTLANKILVDVPSSVCLPSLQSLDLHRVVYKDQDSHVMLLSSCPVLKDLYVFRNKDDNVTRFSVKVPSLQRLTYMDYDVDRGSRSSFDIDSPGLSYLNINDRLGDNSSIQNMPGLDVAVVSCENYHPNDKFMTSLSSVMFLNLGLTRLVACCSASKFSRLVELKLHPYFSDRRCLESLMLLLHKSPKLKVLMINSAFTGNGYYYSLSWEEPSSVPGCLLSHLEIFEWKEFGGGIQENQFVRYILANSLCLKTAGISIRSSFHIKEKMMEELESMYRVSASSQLLFSAKLRWRCKK